MRIGLSVLTRQGQSSWENGLGQNIYHLATLFASIPFVEQVYLVDCGNLGTLPGDTPPIAARFPLVPLAEAHDLVDVMIEAQGSIPSEWLTRFRARGGRSVFHCIGQPYANLVESMVFKDEPGFNPPERCDEVWILPKDATFQAMLRTLHRCPVQIVPFLWASTFLDHVVAIDADNSADGSGSSFGYRPGRLSDGNGARVAIFEPNISVLKAGFIPLFACDTVEREDPGTLSHVTFYNALAFQEHVSFTYILGQSAMHQAGKMTIQGREYLTRAMRTTADIVVSHHNQNDFNYLYFDVVAGGYPLIHNSETFREIGYYYPRFDVLAAANALRHAIAEHDRNLPAYAAATKRTLDRMAPDNRDNRDIYARRLLALTGGVA